MNALKVSHAASVALASSDAEGADRAKARGVAPPWRM